MVWPSCSRTTLERAVAEGILGPPDEAFVGKAVREALEEEELTVQVLAEALRVSREEVAWNRTRWQTCSDIANKERGIRIGMRHDARGAIQAVIGGRLTVEEKLKVMTDALVRIAAIRKDEVRLTGSEYKVVRGVPGTDPHSLPEGDDGT